MQNSTVIAVTGQEQFGIKDGLGLESAFRHRIASLWCSPGTMELGQTKGNERRHSPARFWQMHVVVNLSLTTKKALALG
jgi:hypothetical protein